MEIYLIRHTTPDIVKGTYYGQTDVQLPRSYEYDFDTLKKKIPRKFDAVFTSPLSRCRNFARELESNIFKSDDRLLEMNFGDWEMKLWNEIEKTSFEHWMNNFDTASAPNGESFQSLYDRVIDFYDNEVNSCGLRSSGNCYAWWSYRSIINHILEIPLKNAFSYELDFGSVTLIDKNDGWSKVKYLNR